jgi:hypothetical protein
VKNVLLMMWMCVFLSVTGFENVEGADRGGLSGFEKVIFTGAGRDADEFEAFAAGAKAVGATHINVSTGIPLALWRYDYPGDPYPAWMEHQGGLLTVCPPDAMKDFIPKDYSRAVQEVLTERCAILRGHDLKAMYTTNTPEVLPEAVFEAHPLWRGPRVDQANRARVARFAACVDNEEVLQLYREATTEWTRRWPELELMSLVTTDAGSGLCWSNGLYPGVNGNSLCKDRPMIERVVGLMNTLRAGAGSDCDLHIHPIAPREWMIPSLDEPQRMAQRLEKGMAVKNMEGPDASPFTCGVSSGADWSGWYPVVGIPGTVSYVRSLQAASESSAPRLSVSIDSHLADFNFRVFDRFWKKPTVDERSQLSFLHEMAVEEVGKKHAGKLLSLWLALDEAYQYYSILDFGPIFRMGSVQQRWLTRPFVPFPGELTDEEKSSYRRFIFQARSEEQADDMADIQATRTYAGWSGRYFVTNVLDRAERELNKARGLAGEIIEGLSGEQKKRYELLDLRLRAVLCLVNNSRNAVSYQAQLERVKELRLKAANHSVLGTQSGWDRQLMLETARKEIDNTAVLIEILESTREPVLSLAATKEEEGIRRLGPDIVAQLKKKIDIMNAHWDDYKRIFDTPNP